MIVASMLFSESSLAIALQGHSCFEKAVGAKVEDAEWLGVARSSWHLERHLFLLVSALGCYSPLVPVALLLATEGLYTFSCRSRPGAARVREPLRKAEKKTRGFNELLAPLLARIGQENAL